MNEEKLLQNYTDEEKGAYLGAIASIATADRVASEEELEHIESLADSADFSEAQKADVIRAATELSGEELQRCLDILKTSDLRFSLITDLISFAESDKNYSQEEKDNVEKIAQQLNINLQQFSVLDQFVQKASGTTAEPEEAAKPGFLSSLGFDEKFKKAGINWGAIGKGLLGVAGPLVLARMLSGRVRGGGFGGGGGFAGGKPFGGLAGGGLGSIISMLSGGRGFSSTGGLLSRVLRGFK